MIFPKFTPAAYASTDAFAWESFTAAPSSSFFDFSGSATVYSIGAMSIPWTQKVELFSQHSICRENYFLCCQSLIFNLLLSLIHICLKSCPVIGAKTTHLMKWISSFSGKTTSSPLRSNPKPTQLARV